MWIASALYATERRCFRATPAAGRESAKPASAGGIRQDAVSAEAQESSPRHAHSATARETASNAVVRAYVNTAKVPANAPNAMVPG